MTDERRRLVAAISPVGLIALCRAMQFAAGPALGAWAWLPSMLLFWASIGALVVLVGGRDALKRWRRPARGSRWWRLLAVVMGLVSVPAFLMHWPVVRPPAILFSWLTFALVNPWFEEAYWRGLLLDATEPWGGVPSVTYSALWFAVSHPLIWGVHSVALSRWVVVPVLAVIGVVWGIAYRRSGSLRWPVAAHMCADLFGLSVPVLLNLYVPGAP